MASQEDDPIPIYWIGEQAFFKKKPKSKLPKENIRVRCDWCHQLFKQKLAVKRVINDQEIYLHPECVNAHDRTVK